MENDSTEPYGIIYKVVSSIEPDRVRYIGQTIRGLRQRERGHINDSKSGRYTNPINRWIVKHLDEGDPPVFEVVSTWETQEDLDKEEVRLIAKYKTAGQCDLNLAVGGRGGSKPTSERAKALIGAAHAGEKSYAAKYTWEQVREMRRMYLSGTPTNEIAETFEATRRNVRNVLRGVTWKDSGYTPPSVEELGRRGDFSGNRLISKDKAFEMRRRSLTERKTQAQWGREYGLASNTARRVLKNVTWHDPQFDVSKVLTCTRWNAPKP